MTTAAWVGSYLTEQSPLGMPVGLGQDSEGLAHYSSRPANRILRAVVSCSRNS